MGHYAISQLDISSPPKTYHRTGLGADLEDCMVDLNSVEAALGVTPLTQWHEDYASPGAAGCEIPHMMVQFSDGAGGLQEGRMREAVDALRVAGGVAAFPWSEVPSAADFTGGVSSRLQPSVRHILELKEAIGRITGGTLHGTLIPNFTTGVVTFTSSPLNFRIGYFGSFRSAGHTSENYGRKIQLSVVNPGEYVFNDTTNNATTGLETVNKNAWIPVYRPAGGGGNEQIETDNPTKWTTKSLGGSTGSPPITEDYLRATGSYSALDLAYIDTGYPKGQAFDNKYDTLAPTVTSYTRTALPTTVGELNATSGTGFQYYWIGASGTGPFGATPDIGDGSGGVYDLYEGERDEAINWPDPEPGHLFWRTGEYGQNYSEHVVWGPAETSSVWLYWTSPVLNVNPAIL